MEQKILLILSNLSAADSCAKFMQKKTTACTILLLAEATKLANNAAFLQQCAQASEILVCQSNLEQYGINNSLAKTSTLAHMLALIPEHNNVLICKDKNLTDAVQTKARVNSTPQTKQIVLLFSKENTILNQQMLDISLTLGALAQKPIVIFTQDGNLLLQTSHKLYKPLTALPLYDVHEIYSDTISLQQHDLVVKKLTIADIINLCVNSKVVLDL